MSETVELKVTRQQLDAGLELKPGARYLIKLVPGAWKAQLTGLYPWLLEEQCRWP